MELPSKTARCKSCGLQTTMPPGTYLTWCPMCRAMIRAEDPLSHTHDAFSRAASKFKDVMHAASNDISMMASSMNTTFLRSGMSGFSQPPQIRSLQPIASATAGGRKRAVLCGVSYNGQKYKLNGSINDVKCMKYFLINRLGFANDSILMLTEEEADPNLIPTKSNMRKALQWLVHGCHSGDSLVFHYSGHASQQLDYDRDEVDGYDEALWPVDHHFTGTIVDDEINETIVRSLPPGVKLHAIVDACHSGTILDLQYVCRMNRDGRYEWENQGCLGTYKGTNGGLAVSFSACDDDQIAVDTTVLSADNAATGAMTYSFIQAVQNEPGLTYGRLLNAMRQTIREARTGCPLKKVLHQKSLQEPQLSSSKEFDIHSTPFTL
ncbi:metacaspase-1-like [Andrographis paniculata]|uniref:metacaspase-1-like n=1 Tax=Andrographis paniculata TaxID=175694 RepID=UPI0021E824D1|nr:metacaspase-1-like [Andrographis paniculata]